MSGPPGAVEDNRADTHPPGAAAVGVVVERDWAAVAESVGDPARVEASKAGAGGWAFHEGVTALAQYVAREGRLPGRGNVQVLADEVEHRTELWLGNLKARRNRLDPAQLAALVELVADWAR
ncbi:hypothetical protein ACFWJQ_18435 [Streptomyces goshikiensis]|uniref:hypothetical protein n=1 Tax=Streptomyces goshikiensis TaxID=1942 RepID=UPI002E0D6D0B|nr:hypothetical protein OG224_00065 [Streptomyces goshikiensis]WSS02986.1 hypothetical protein OG224_35750 [Streptomyces goshikiensis]WSS03938.1 hypothetical protein OG224_38595 [Streptomyces goshikiensis]